ncbi:MAG: CoA-transferase [Desulfarculaceae bacterium]
MSSKAYSLTEAVKEIPDGAMVAVGGNINSRRPMALALEIIAQKKRGLTLLALTAGLACDVMIGAGCVRRLRASYTGLEIFGMAPNFRSRAEAGELEIVEETEMSVTAGLRAALSQMPFLPARVMQGTDILSVRPDIKMVSCPYTGRAFPALPAIKPGVALIHALATDEKGNAWLGGNLGIDIEAAQLADLTIVSSEEMLSHEELIKRGVDIIGLCVDRVVPSPGGARPTSCHPRYPLEGDEILDYQEACAAGEFEAYVKGLRSRNNLAGLN